MKSCCESQPVCLTPLLSSSLQNFDSKEMKRFETFSSFYKIRFTSLLTVKDSQLQHLKLFSVKSPSHHFCRTHDTKNFNCSVLEYWPHCGRSLFEITSTVVIVKCSDYLKKVMLKSTENTFTVKGSIHPQKNRKYIYFERFYTCWCMCRVICIRP